MCNWIMTIVDGIQLFLLFTGKDDKKDDEKDKKKKDEEKKRKFIENIFPVY